ncbi:MAG: CPBP family intramembrane metalloprotease [Chloroflexi bacterium]|nr:CPBP family intramembrane metalloprotease [Chloroflexota bacterium]
MHLSLPALLYGLLLILAANYEWRARESGRLTALLSLGLTQLDILWTNVEQLVFRLNPFQQPRFDRRKPVHRAAALLLLAQLTWATLQLRSLGGALEQTFFETDLGDLLFNLTGVTFIYVMLSALGAGWGLRRDWRGVTQRLGLRSPSHQDWVAGLVFGSLLSVGMMLATLALRSLGSADEAGARPLIHLLQESLPAALLVAMLAAAGEEILFRGALQPVFGLFVSSLFFALIHAQYGLSVALLVLFFVGLGFGMVRMRFSTTAAIICHATYNFLPFLLLRLPSA